MKLLPANTRIPANVPHVKLPHGVLVPDAYAAALYNPLPLGDYVEAVTKATGIKRVWSKMKSGDCGGCKKRRAALNKIGATVASKIGLQT